MNNQRAKLKIASQTRRAFLQTLPLLVASCAARPSHRTREGNLTGSETSLSVEDEKRLTAEVMPQMRKDYPPLNNTELQNYIHSMGQTIVRASNLDGNPYRYTFTVVDSPQINAFALPAGTVFVTSALIANCSNEAELAGVVGHEVGHIRARHSAIRMESARRAQSQSWKYAVGGGLLGGIAGLGLGKLLCPPSDAQCKATAMQTGAALGAGGGMLVQKYGFMANSREDEMEADRIGFRTSVAAGWSKDHVGGFFEKLLKMEQRSKVRTDGIARALQDAMSTHPPSVERVTQMRELASSQPSQSQPIVNSSDFLRLQRLVLKKS